MYSQPLNFVVQVEQDQKQELKIYLKMFVHTRRLHHWSLVSQQQLLCPLDLPVTLAGHNESLIAMTSASIQIQVDWDPYQFGNDFLFNIWHDIFIYVAI
jgi:hypothetical protein